MPELESLFVAPSVEHQITERPVSEAGTVAVVRYPAFPAVMPTCVAVGVWKRAQGDVDGRRHGFALEIKPPGGASIECGMEMVVRGDLWSSLLRVKDIPLVRAGRLRFEVRSEAGVAGHCALEIVGPGYAPALSQDDGDPLLSLVEDVRMPCAGISLHQGAARAFARSGSSRLELRREYGNPYDADAVAVWCAHGQLGYVPRGHAGDVARLLERGVRLQAELLWVATPDAKTVGVRFRIVAV